MKRAHKLYAVAGFGLSAAFALSRGWTLPEFCWSVWLAGLVYAWSCVLTAALQIILTARSGKPGYERLLPILRHMRPDVFLLAMIAAAAAVGLAAFYLYGFLFAFYGIFLSVFAAMEPRSLFGPDGFINSDFFTPAFYLLARFWPMALGVLIAGWEDFLRRSPWRRVALPMQEEIVRMHVLTLTLPFLSLLAWALFGERYQSIAIVVLMGMFYLFPSGARGGGAESGGTPDREAREMQAGRTTGS